MRLIDLAPKLTEENLEIDCPKCSKHRILIPLVGNKNAKRTWAKYGEIENLELRPSVKWDCCHFTIVDGKVRLA